MSNTISEGTDRPNEGEQGTEAPHAQPIKTDYDAFSERLKVFYQTLDINMAEFERRCNLSNGQGAKVMSGKMGITLEKMRGIFEAYPELNPSWLIAGTGSMLYSEEPEQEYEIPEGSDPIVLLEETFEALITDRFQLNKCRLLLRAIEATQRSAQNELINLHREYLTLTKVLLDKKKEGSRL